MPETDIYIVSQAIRYIEDHLEEKLDLKTVASALHYSKYHIHRIFAKTAGITMHDYVRRRKLTESAKLLVFSDQPIIEAALAGGYESRQAFTDIFKAMYKTTPAAYRAAEKFYPLQLELRLGREPVKTEFCKEEIRFAAEDDIKDWMELVRLTFNGYPCLDKEMYLSDLMRHMKQKQALILRNEGAAAGIMGFSAKTGTIDFWAVHPQYRDRGIEKVFLDKLQNELLPGREISVTTYRSKDRADTGWRDQYLRLGFEEKELMTEFGYPTQRFVLHPKGKEETQDGKQSE